MLLANETDSIAAEALQASDTHAEDKMTVLFEMRDDFDLGFEFDFDEICKEAGNDTWHLIF